MKIEFDKLNAKAIILGFLTYAISTIIFSALIGLVVGIFYALNGGDNIREYIKSYSTGISFLLLSVFYYLAFTILGGYVAGRIAKGYEIFNSITVGMVEVILGILTISDSSYPIWYKVIVFLLIIPAAYLGGILARRQHAGKVNS